MDCHPEPTRECYWDTSNRSPHHQALYTAISRDHWEQINRYFHIWDPEDPKITDPKITDPKITDPKPGLKPGPKPDPKPDPKPATPDQKVQYIANYLRTSFTDHWHPSTHIAVNECIEPFFGRCSDTVNIPTKPTPIGFKIWCLADAGYILDFL
jgi:Transposase IS4